MASCHSIHHQQDNNQLSGNPVDTGMFEFTGYTLQQNPSTSSTSVISPSSRQTINIIKEFPFESALQRMSVLTTNNEEESDGGHVTVFTKGSPEMVLSFCAEMDDLDLLEVQSFLKRETDLGHRVLALASKQISKTTGTEEFNDVQSFPRSAVESDMQFCGLVVFENSVKPISKETIGLLTKGGLRSIMATGDHLNTAFSVARHVGMVERNQIVYQLKIRNDSLVYETMDQVNATNRPYSPNSDNSSNNGEQDEKSTLVTLDKDSSLIKYCCILTGIITLCVLYIYQGGEFFLEILIVLKSFQVVIFYLCPLRQFVLEKSNH